jgi:hypothetical protein
MLSEPYEHCYETQRKRDSMITSIDQATPKWITRQLQNAGALNSGAVESVQIINNAAFNSRAAHLVLRYSEEPPASAPQRLFLKLKGDHDGALEVEFYRMVEEYRKCLPMLVRCWGAEYDEDSGNSYCLLEDYSATHRPPVTRAAVLSGNGIPEVEILDKIVDVVAAFHAFWWEHDKLGRAKGVFEIRHWFRDDTCYQALVAKREKQYSRFLSLESGWFPKDLRLIYDTALGQLSGIWEKYLRRRILNRSKITLTHGDCYFSQLLVPVDSVGQTSYLVDFDSVSGNFGAFDLAFLFPTFWTPAQRQQGNRETVLLRHYHQQLIIHGVRNYLWEDLLLDYRLMITKMLFDPFLDYNPHNRTYWWPKMQCLAAAYDDLDCKTLLG